MVRAFLINILQTTFTHPQPFQKITMRKCPTLYKYLEKQYAEQMVNEGRIRIALLNFYRNIEALGTAVGDAQEGKASWSITADPEGTMFIPYLKTPLGEITNLTISKSQYIGIMYGSTPPLYVYCTSEKKDRAIMNSLHTETSKPDTCVMIHQPIPFYRAITDEIFRTQKQKIRDFVGPQPCIYEPRHSVIDGKQFAEKSSTIDWGQGSVWRQKDPDYIDQAEVRGVWSSSESEPEEFIYIQCDAIKSMCEIVSL